jgi:hypothetical protein
LKSNIFSAYFFSLPFGHLFEGQLAVQSAVDGTNKKIDKSVIFEKSFSVYLLAILKVSG